MVPDAVDLSQALLDAKFSVPRPRRGSVSRGDLITAAGATECRVVGVTAPAGYGKSTFLAQMARADGRRIVWVSLDRYDDDPAVLLAVLASAYARTSPGNTELVAKIVGAGMSPLGRAAPRLAAALRSSPSPFMLVLDDLHALQSPACHDVLSVVISGIPPGSRLVAASRAEQPHLPRLRAAGDAVEFLVADLAMGAAGAEQIFANADVPLTRELADAVTERTEGWPAGLYLAAMIARSRQKGAPTGVSGDDRLVADYLYRESLMQLPKKTQRFLRRTAVLDQLSASLCDAVLEEPHSQERLRRLEASSLFLVGLDNRREWYRYHALFREFLLGELRRVEPGVIPRLHRRAADWYAANGSPGLSLEHLLAVKDRDRCVQVATSLVLPTFQAGKISTVHRWLTELGDPAIQSHPPLAVLAGWITTLSGQTSEAQRWAAFLDSATHDGLPEDGTASFASARAMLRAIMCGAGPAQMLADTTLALAQEPPWSPWRDVAVTLHGEAHLLLGDLDAAESLFTEGATRAASAGNASSQIDAEAELALLAMDRGHWDQASAHVGVALAVVEDANMNDYSTSLLAFVAAARACLHRGELDEADRQLTRMMRARPVVTYVLPWLAVRVRLFAAKVYWARGDFSSARHLMREIRDILRLRPNLGTLIEQVTEFHTIMDSASTTGAIGGSPLSQAELRLLPFLQTHLTIGEIGERLFITRNTASSEISSIYRKLGVSARGEAVERATAIGLLGG